MSAESIARVRACYEAINEAYRTGEYAGAFEAYCHPDVILRTSGMFPESGDYCGYHGLQEFASNQADAFEQISVRPTEFIDAGARVVVPVEFGGAAMYTGITAVFSVVHVWTRRELRISRLDMYQRRAEALVAVGLAHEP